MKIKKQDLLYSGKVKSLYKTDKDGLLITEFRNDTTAFNGVKHELLDNKGKINNEISTFIMNKLEEEGVPTHLEVKLSDTEIVVKHLKMIPVECVIRNIAAGSLCKRLGIEEKSELDPPLVEFFYKSDELGDPMISREHAITFEWATPEQLDEMVRLTRKINSVMKAMFDKAGMLLVDAKFEFGIGSNGKVYLGDEISPDSCRIWDSISLESLDKDRFRKDLGNVIESYQIIADRLGV